MVIVLTQATTPLKLPPKKTEAIKSFLYHAPKVEPLVTKESNKQPAQEQLLQNKILEKVPEPKETQETTKKIVPPLPVTKPDNEKSDTAETTPPSTPSQPKEPLPTPLPLAPKKKLDSFTQLQRLRSKLNSSANAPTDSSYQSYQPPSVFNSKPKTVPHSVPLKDKEKEREKNTKNMGSGIAITKGDDGTCSITQDMSVYGLSEGSSTQHFNCGESKFDKSFRDHMKKVKAKLGK